MSTPKRYLNEQVHRALASQYVAGLLRGRARVRFIHLMQRHRIIQQSVEFWEQRLDSLNDRLPEVAPPAELWTRLQNQLDEGASAAAPAPAPRAEVTFSREREPGSWISRLFGNLWVGGAAFATACMLAVMLFLQVSREPALVNYVAVLEDSLGQAQLVATSSKVSRELRLDILGADLQAGEQLVLWAKSSEDGSFYSFGPVAAKGSEIIALDELAWQKVKTAHSLVLTREASPNPPQPSSDQVASGLCVKINYDPVKA